MARRGAVPRPFGRISPTHRTPAYSTWCVAGVAIVWFVGLSLISENALYDSLTALSLLIACYYALTGFACAIYFRKVLLTSARHFLFIGVGPVVGGLMLVWLLWLSAVQMSDPANSYGGTSWFGMGPPLVIGILIAVVGVSLMVATRIARMPFWKERAGVVDPADFEGATTRGPES